MTTNYPATSIDVLKNDWTNATSVVNDHPNEHNNAADAIIALQTKLGVDSSAVTSSIDYLLKNTASIDPGHKHLLASLSDFNVTSPVDGQALTYDNATGKWINTATSTANASATTAGVTEVATQAEIDASTATGGTGATLSISPDQLAASIYNTQLPSATEKAALVGTSGTAVSGSNKLVDADDAATTATASKIVRALGTGKIDSTFVDVSPSTGNGTRTNAQGSGTENITGLGFQPSFVQIKVGKLTAPGGGSDRIIFSDGGTDGTNTFSFMNSIGNSNEAVYSTSLAINALLNNFGFTGTIAMTADGFDITWTEGASNAGDVSYSYIAYR